MLGLPLPVFVDLKSPNLLLDDSLNVKVCAELDYYSHNIDANFHTYIRK